MKKYLLIYLLLLAGINARAQDFEYGKPTTSELEMKTYSKDSSANAVVLKEFGTARISSYEHTPLEFQYHVRIKILNSKGFEHGDIIIRLHKQQEREETLESVEGVTFSKDENGIIREAPLEKANIFHVNKSKYVNQVKFAMPNLKALFLDQYNNEIKQADTETES